MKKYSLLVFTALILLSAGCLKIENASELDSFTGTNVEVGDNNGASSQLKLLILNEGSWPNESTLDVLDLHNKKFYADIFAQANPDITQGLGNGGNDFLIANNRIWIAMSASNQITALNPATFKKEVQIDIECPRCLVANDNYLFVSSYGSAIYGGNPSVGRVYRVNLKDFTFDSVDVGYQPEGMVIVDGKLYVANSGGYNATKDNRIHVIDIDTFTVEKDDEGKDDVLKLPVSNLNMMRNIKDQLWVSSYTTYDAVTYSITAPSALTVIEADGSIRVVSGVHADKITESDGWIYAVGNNEEMNYGSDYCLYKVNAKTKEVTTTHFAGTDLKVISYPYCILVNPFTSDVLIADASFTGDSMLYCFDSDLKYKWSVITGVGTGHLMLY